MNPNAIYLSANDVAVCLRISKATLWRWARARSDFPKPVKFGAKTTRWKKDEVLSFRGVEWMSLTDIKNSQDVEHTHMAESIALSERGIHESI